MWAVIAFGSFSCVLQYGPYFDPLGERNMRSVWKIQNGLLQGRSKPIVGLRGMHACIRSDGHEP